LPRGSLPDATLTPGDTLQVTERDICYAGYSSKVRNVPSNVKDKVYRSYGVTHHLPGEYEVDHLIPLSIGGSNSVRNLWPEPRDGIVWNALVKDRLEDLLHRLVCKGKVPLTVAQKEFASDWIAAYKKYFHTEVPLSKTKRR
jgi:hypothetical protein